ncbi:MAG: hypothetical protein ACXWUX_12035, partial [Allosphingosinicella sp.]
MGEVADRWRALRDAPRTWTEAVRSSGRRPVRTIGERVPRDRLAPRGLVAVPVLPEMARDTPRADNLVGNASMPRRGRALLEALLCVDAPSPLLIVHDDAVAPQLFAALRDLVRDGEAPAFDLHFLDLPRGQGAAAGSYCALRLAQLDSWLNGLDPGEPFHAATGPQWLARLDEARARGELATADLQSALVASRLLPPSEFAHDAEGLLAEARPASDGDPVALAGLAAGDWPLIAGFEAHHPVVADNLVHVALYGRPERGADEAAALVVEATARGARRIVHHVAQGDERAAWFAPLLRAAAAVAKLGFEIEELDERRLPLAAAEMGPAAGGDDRRPPLIDDERDPHRP